MASTSDPTLEFRPDLPISISQIGGRYVIFDVKLASWLRREHRICGVTIGTLPIAPSQNLFLGVPVEIMPEEAQLLAERGIAVVVDDARAHDLAVRAGDKARRDDYMARIERQAIVVKQAKDQEKADSKKRGLEKRLKKSTGPSRSTRYEPATDLFNLNDDDPPQDEETTSSPAPETVTVPDDSPIKLMPVTALSSTYRITPATSRLLLPDASSSPGSIKDLPSSYPFYRHLHDQGFFMTPGLRFGCRYTVYPGDPLRFHSHFLAVGTEWNEEIDLMEVVGGGRLGTGVKKGFLLGGEAPIWRCEDFQCRMGGYVAVSSHKIQAHF